MKRSERDDRSEEREYEEMTDRERWKRSLDQKKMDRRVRNGYGGLGHQSPTVSMVVDSIMLWESGVVGRGGEGGRGGGEGWGGELEGCRSGGREEVEGRWRTRVTMEREREGALGGVGGGERVGGGGPRRAGVAEGAVGGRGGGKGTRDCPLEALEIMSEENRSSADTEIRETLSADEEVPENKVLQSPQQPSPVPPVPPTTQPQFSRPQQPHSSPPVPPTAQSQSSSPPTSPPPVLQAPNSPSSVLQSPQQPSLQSSSPPNSPPPVSSPPQLPNSNSPVPPNCPNPVPPGPQQANSKSAWNPP
nr:WAS/WASL-interacting protein family member 3-like [Salvelinus alpinus]